MPSRILYVVFTSFYSYICTNTIVSFIFLLLDIQIIRHPLLSSLMTDEDSPVVPPDFYEESLLENELEAVSAPIMDVSTEQRIASIRRKEALLRKKKELLKHLIKKLRWFHEFFSPHFLLYLELWCFDYFTNFSFFFSSEI